jgi:hypothetical protein
VTLLFCFSQCWKFVSSLRLIAFPKNFHKSTLFGLTPPASGPESEQEKTEKDVTYFIIDYKVRFVWFD